MVCSVSHLDSIIMSYSYFAMPFYNAMIVAFVKATKDRNITCMTSINSFVLSFEVTMKVFTHVWEFFMLCGVHGVLITLSCSMIDMHIGDSLLLDCYAMTGCLCGILP
jgi:hypothetical protein